VEAIYNGDKGHHLLTADVGLHKRQRERGLQTPAIARRIPEHILPHSIPAPLRAGLTQYSIPDAMLYSLSKDGKRREYIVVEIKYCRDTRTHDQEQRATNQHAQLIDTIKQHDPTADVQLCILLLGVGGSIYNTFTTRMEKDLGVKGTALVSLCNKLHLLAITELENIWKYRRARLNRLIPNYKKQSGGIRSQTPRTTGPTHSPAHRKRPKR
jgi:hypothetical protein